MKRTKVDKGSRRPLPASAAWLPLLVGAVLIATALVSSWRSVRATVSGFATTATIVNFERGGDTRAIYPVVHYADANGRQHTVRSPSAMARRSMTYSEGSSLPVLVSRESPEQIRENTFRGLWLVPMVTGVLGLAAFTGGMMVRSMIRREG